MEKLSVQRINKIASLCWKYPNVKKSFKKLCRLKMIRNWLCLNKMILLSNARNNNKFPKCSKNRKTGKNFRERLIDPWFQDWEQQGNFQSQSKIIGYELNHIIKYETLNEEFYINKLDAIKENIEIAKEYISTYDFMYNNMNSKLEGL